MISVFLPAFGVVLIALSMIRIAGRPLVDVAHEASGPAVAATAAGFRDFEHAYVRRGTNLLLRWTGASFALMSTWGVVAILCVALAYYWPVFIPLLVMAIPLVAAFVLAVLVIAGFVLYVFALIGVQALAYLPAALGWLGRERLVTATIGLGLVATGLVLGNLARA